MSVSGLLVPQYSASALALAAGLGSAAGSTPTKGVYLDGRFDVAAMDGQPTFSYPFAAQGDNITAESRARWWQSAKYFQPLALGSAVDGMPGVLLDEDDFQDLGGGILSWERTTCPLPQVHEVYESFSYGFQFAYTDGSNNFKVGEQAFTTSSRVVSEFFLVKDRAKWPALLAPRICPIVDNLYYKRGQGDLHLDPVGKIFFVSKDAEILAEDSTYKLWRYPFMERRSRYITSPSTAFWGTATSIPKS